MAKITLSNDVLNNGMVFKFLVTAEECPGISQHVDNYIKVIISNTIELIGCLTRVSSWAKKEKGVVVAVYKEITLLVDNISCKEGEVKFPDKKDPFVEDLDIIYISD